MKINNFNSKSIPLYLGVIMLMGLSNVALAGTSTQVDNIEFPDNIVFLKEKPNGSLFVGYESVNKNNCSGMRCFGFGIIDKNNSVQLSKYWLTGSFELQDIFNEKTTAKMDKKGNVYISLFPSKQILKLSDPTTYPKVIFDAPPELNRSNNSKIVETKRVKDFIFNNDFSQMYVGLDVEPSIMGGIAAVDLTQGEYPVIWHDSRTKANSVQLNPVSKELIYQGYNTRSTSPLVAYVMSATSGKYITGGEPLFTGNQSVQVIENTGYVAYGLNLKDCSVTKMKLREGAVGDKLWTNEVNGCDADITQGEKKTISLNSFDNFVYAGYGNVITIFERDNSNKKVDILPPLGKFYGDIKFSNNTQKAYRMFTDGSEYGVLEFDSNGKTKEYKALEKVRAFATYGNHLYVGEGKKVVKYKLDSTTI